MHASDHRVENCFWEQSQIFEIPLFISAIKFIGITQDMINSITFLWSQNFHFIAIDELMNGDVSFFLYGYICFLINFWMNFTLIRIDNAFIVTSKQSEFQRKLSNWLNKIVGNNRRDLAEINVKTKSTNPSSRFGFETMDLPLACLYGYMHTSAFRC